MIERGRNRRELALLINNLPRLYRDQVGNRCRQDVLAVSCVDQPTPMPRVRLPPASRPSRRQGRLLRSSWKVELVGPCADLGAGFVGPGGGVEEELFRGR